MVRPGDDSELGDGEEESSQRRWGKAISSQGEPRNPEPQDTAVVFQSEAGEMCKVQEGGARKCGSQGEQSEVYNIRKPYSCRSGGFPKRHLFDGGDHSRYRPRLGGVVSCRFDSLVTNPR
jgi:hypothetical protein